MRAAILLTLSALAPAVKTLPSHPVLLEDTLRPVPLGFCLSRCLSQQSNARRRGFVHPLSSKPWPLANAALLDTSSPTHDFASLRKLVLLMKQRGQCETRRVKKALKTSEHTKESLETVSNVLHGLRLGRSLRYRFPHPSSSRTALFGTALQLIVSKLHETALSVIMEPQARRDLEFTTDEIARVRDEVSRQHAVGEKHLTLLSQLFANRFTGGKYTCKSIVTAQADQYSFTLSQTVPHSALRGGADSLRIAAQQLHEVRVDVSDGADGGRAVADNKMIDHSIEFEADQWNEWGVHRVVAHARSSKDLWKLISESLFAVDLPDQLSEVDNLSMYEIKIVVDDIHHAQAMHRSLVNFCWHDGELREHGVPVTARTRRLELLEQASSAAPPHAGGAERRVSTFNWLDTAVAVQVQTLCEHYEEAEMASLGHRRKLEERRERLHRQLAEQTPLFGFSRELLQWIVDASAAADAPPSCDSIHVEVHD